MAKLLARACVDNILRVSTNTAHYKLCASAALQRSRAKFSSSSRCQSLLCCLHAWRKQARKLCISRCSKQTSGKTHLARSPVTFRAACPAQAPTLMSLQCWPSHWPAHARHSSSTKQLWTAPGPETHAPPLAPPGRPMQPLQQLSANPQPHQVPYCTPVQYQAATVTLCLTWRCHR